MDLHLTTRTAIITGASKGIGFATARMLAAEGARIVIASRDPASLAEAQRNIRDETNADVLAVPTDMSVAEDITRLVAETVRAYNALDIVVANAGGPPPGLFEQQDDAAWQRALDQNFMSNVRLIRDALPHLKQSDQPRIITITSSGVKEPVDGLITSSAARLATAGLVKSLSKELGPYGITVNNVGPGLTLTDRIRPVLEAQAKSSGRSYEDILEERAKTIPLGRLGQPEDVAATIVFLASSHARQISGQTIVVDGGALRSSL